MLAAINEVTIAALIAEPSGSSLRNMAVLNSKPHTHTHKREFMKDVSAKKYCGYLSSKFSKNESL